MKHPAREHSPARPPGTQALTGCVLSVATDAVAARRGPSREPWNRRCLSQVRTRHGPTEASQYWGRCRTAALSRHEAPAGSVTVGLLARATCLASPCVRRKKCGVGRTRTGSLPGRCRHLQDCGRDVSRETFAPCGRPTPQCPGARPEPNAVRGCSASLCVFAAGTRVSQSIPGPQAMESLRCANRLYSAALGTLVRSWSPACRPGAAVAGRACFDCGDAWASSQ